MAVLPAKHKSALATAGVVGAIGLGGYLLWKIASPAGETAKNIGDTAAAATKAVAATTQAASQTIQVGAAFAQPSTTADEAQSAVEAYKPAQHDLEVVVDQVDHAPGWDVLHTVRAGHYYVRDRQTGQRVPALVHFHATFAATQLLFPDKTYWYAGFGTDIITVQAGDIPYVTGEAYFQLFATAPGYNQSPTVEVS